MTPEEWSRIQQGIFAGESGGDYGALFGYQNRPNGRFSDVDLTSMTINQALDFASPSGPYGQYVKGQVGHVATPMGAYQVVGTTLRDAKEALGLTGDETMTPEMQDQIGQWIYKAQGTGAWEGYKPMTDAQTIGAETMAAIGRQPQGILATEAATPTEGSQMIEEQQPRGLLGSLGIQKMEDGAAGETGQRFYERDTFKDTAAALAQGFAAMGSSPGLQKMTADIASQRSESRARNKTVEYLRTNGRDDLADMIDQGMISGKDAAGIMLAKPSDDRTALMQNYEYFISQGMTPEQAMAAVKSGSTTNVNMGDVGEGSYIYGSDAGLPAGYRLDKTTGEASPIPGGPADIEVAATAATSAAEQEAANTANTALAESADDYIRLIDSVISDPALPSITGIVQGRLPPLSQAGEDLNVRIAQLQGKVFLEAFQSLKGAGAITEREGIAAAEAGARLRRTQSGPAYIEALNELKMYLDRGRRRALAGVTASDGDSYSGGVIGDVTVGAPIK